MSYADGLVFFFLAPFKTPNPVEISVPNDWKGRPKILNQVPSTDERTGPTASRLLAELSIFENNLVCSMADVTECMRFRHFPFYKTCNGQVPAVSLNRIAVQERFPLNHLLCLHCWRIFLLGGSSEDLVSDDFGHLNKLQLILMPFQSSVI
jgi:hypothetical protein